MQNIIPKNTKVNFLLIKIFFKKSVIKLIAFQFFTKNKIFFHFTLKTI